MKEERPANLVMDSADARRLVLVIVGALVLYTYGLGAGALWDHDETTYTQVAREMLQRRDPFTLYVNGALWFDKPPLFMWLQALTGAAFGFTTFTARIWSAIAAAASVGATFLTARLLHGPRAGLMAAAILATMIQFAGSARTAILDPILLACMLLAFYMYLVGHTTGDRRAYLWAFMWAGWATLAKGPIGLALPAIAVLALWSARREWWRWREIPLWGLAIYALIGLSWYVIEVSRHGVGFLQATVGHYMLGRVVGVVDGQSGPPWYYIPVIALGGFPWAAFFPPAIMYLLRRRDELGSQVALAWIAMILMMFSISTTKVANYILPFYPFVAIGIARLWRDALDGVAEAGRLVQWAFGLMFVGVAAFIATAGILGLVRYPLEVGALRTPLLIAVGVLSVGPVAALVAYALRRPAAALAALALTPAFALPVLVHHTLPAIEQQRALPRIARSLHAEARPDDRVAAVRMPEAASLIYYGERPVIFVGTTEQLDQALCRHDRLFLVTPETEYRAWMAARLPAQVEEYGSDRGYRILFKDRRTRCDGDRPLQ